MIKGMPKQNLSSKCPQQGCAALLYACSIFIALVVAGLIVQTLPQRVHADEMRKVVLRAVVSDRQLCTALLARYRHAWRISYGEGLLTCVQVAQEADKQGLDRTIALAAGSAETRFNKDAVSKTGAVGPLQVKRNLWCPNNPQCPPIEAGVRAMATFVKNRPPTRNAIGAFTGESVTGNQQHADHIYDVHKWLQRTEQCACSIP